MRNQPAVVFLMRAVEAGFDDSLASGSRSGTRNCFKFRSEELAPLTRAFLVHIQAALDLLLDGQKDAWNHRALDAQLMRNVAQQRKRRLAHLLTTELGAARAAPGIRAQSTRP